MNTDLKPRFLSTDSAIAYLGIGKSKFWAVAGDLGIRSAKNSRKALWRREDVDRIGDYLEGTLTDAAA